jgi:hypothetical protein
LHFLLARSAVETCPSHDQSRSELATFFADEESDLDAHVGKSRNGKSEWVDLDQLMDFLFPPGALHPESAGRLFVFGRYGPVSLAATALEYCVLASRTHSHFKHALCNVRTQDH